MALVANGRCVISMPPSSQRLPWWDREFDLNGQPIRADVRKAAIKVWPLCVALARSRVPNAEFEAQQLLERTVMSVSQGLTMNNSPAEDRSGLLVYRFRLGLLRIAKSAQRVQGIGAVEELDKLAGTVGGTEEVERRIFLEELVRCLSPQNQGILRLRIEGLSWRQISRMLKVSTSAVRNSFWRDVRSAYGGLQESHSPGDDEENE